MIGKEKEEKLGLILGNFCNLAYNNLHIITSVLRKAFTV